MNKEGKTCAQLVELTIKVFHATRKIFQVIHNNLVIHQVEPTLQANKYVCKLPAQASNGFPLSIHRGKGKKLIEQVYPCMFQHIFARVY